MQHVIREFEQLETAIIDASSAIYMTRSGFLEAVSAAVRLQAPSVILGEIGTDVEGIATIECAGGSGSNDERLVACAREYGLPVITEDKQIIRALKELGIPYFNALMMLHFLLFKRKIEPDEHAICLENLKKFAWYDKKVWAFGEEVFSFIR